MAYASTNDLSQFQFLNGDILKAVNGESYKPLLATPLAKLLFAICKLKPNSAVKAEHMQMLLDRGYIQIEKVEYGDGVRRVSVLTGELR